MSRAVIWLKRDLRFRDNRVFKEAQGFREVIPVFIFDEEILTDLKVDEQRLLYIVKAIEGMEVKVYTLRGKTAEVFKYLLEKLKPDAVITQKAYSWSGEERVQEVKKLCNLYGVKFLEVFDGFLVEPESVPQRKVFTPFYNEWVKLLDLKEVEVKDVYIPDLNLPTVESILKEINFNHIAFKPEDCRERLNSFNFERYEETRNYPYMDGTSKLSPCIRFGILSVREVFKRAKVSEAFIKELAWREFWYHIKYHFPWTKGVEFQEKRRNIRWENREDYIEAFFSGKTGYPIVDAGVRQLKQEKWIHNRIRMILGSFLTKDVLVDWRIGEAFFKEHLLDYDEVVNVGNWQWIASVGADPKPLRIFNPILQARKFDPECIYIKRYLPELSSIPCEQLQDPLSYKLNYYKPIVNHHERVSIVKSMYGVSGE